jgi:hypothetical protein
MLCKLISLCNRANGERRQSDADPVRLNEIRHLFYKKKHPRSVLFLQHAPLLGGSCKGKADTIAPLPCVSLPLFVTRLGGWAAPLHPGR